MEFRGPFKSTYFQKTYIWSHETSTHSDSGAIVGSNKKNTATEIIEVTTRIMQEMAQRFDIFRQCSPKLQPFCSRL